MFPLPINAFPVLHCSPQQLHKYETAMTALLAQLLALDLQPKTSKFTPKFQSAYHFQRDYANCSVDQILTNLTATSMSECRRVSSLFHEDLIDAALLQTLAHSSEHSRILKWTAHEVPLTKNRDNLSLQQVGICTDLAGQKVGYLLSEAVDDVPEWPPLTQFTRMKYQMAVLFRQKTPKMVQATVYGSMDTGVHIPSWLSRLLVMSVHKRINHFVSNIYYQHSEFSSSFVIGQSQRKDCFICFNEFGTFRRRHFCRSCGENICSKCSLFRKIFKDNDVKRKNTRICKLCVSMTMGEKKAASEGSKSSQESYVFSEVSTQNAEEESDFDKNLILLNDLRSTSTTVTGDTSFDFDNSSESSMQVFDFNKMNTEISQQKNIVDAMRTNLQV